MTERVYERAFIQAAFRALLIMQQLRLAPPLSIGWQRSPVPTLSLQVLDDEFAKWYGLLSSPVSHNETHEGQLHVVAEGIFHGCDCQRVRVVTVTQMPLACEITADGWCTVHRESSGPVFCKATA